MVGVEKKLGEKENATLVILVSKKKFSVYHINILKMSINIDDLLETFIKDVILN